MSCFLFLSKFIICSLFYTFFSILRLYFLFFLAYNTFSMSLLQNLSPFIYLIVIVSYVTVIQSQIMNVSLLQPMELTQDNSTITSITNDYMSRQFIIITFSNLQLRKYKADFSSYTNITLPQVVEKGKYINTTGNIPIPNSGTPPLYFNSSFNTYTTLSNNSTTMRVYNVTTLIQLAHYTHNSSVDDWDADVFTYNGQTNIYFTFYNTEGAFSYINGVLTPISFMYSSWPLFCRQRAVYVEFGLMMGSAPSNYYFGLSRNGLCTDTLNRNVFFYIMRKYSIDTAANILVMAPQVRFNPTNSYFPNAANIIYKTGMDFTFILQDIAGSLSSFMNFFNFQSFISSPHWSTNPILAASSYTTTALIHTDGIIQAQVVNNSFQYVSTITSFSNFSYAFSAGCSFDILFQPKISSKIYKVSLCLGNKQVSWANGAISCASYNCTSSNCISCPINPNLCRACIAGSTFIPSNYSCSSVLTPPNNTNTTNNASTTNNTTPSNNTNTNNTSNNTINNDPTNTTNNTANNSSNNTPNNTNDNSSNNTNNNNSNLNPNDPQNSTSPYQIELDPTYMSYFDQIQFLNFLLELFNSLLTFLTQIMKETIKYPIARKVFSSLFYYFGNFQDLFFYQFHDRTFSPAMDNLFQQISNIQYQKWQLLKASEILQKVGVDPIRMTNLTDYQAQYLTFAYSTPNHLETGSEGLLSNSLNFFIVTIPLTLCTFLLCRLVFYLSFKYSVSQLFRKFDFWAFFIILLLEGNIQQFSFYMAAEWRQVFFFEASQKIIKCLIFIFGFILSVVSFGSFFFFLSLYRKLNRYLLDNNKNILPGVSLYLLQNYIRNFVMGILNSYLRFLPYQTMVKYLITFDLIFGCFFLVNLDSRVFVSKAKVWIYLILNLQKMLLLVTFFIDYQNTSNPLIDSVQQYIILFFIAVFGAGMANELLHTAFEVSKPISSFLAKKFCHSDTGEPQGKAHLFQQHIENIFALPSKFVEKLSNPKILRVESMERNNSNKIAINTQADKLVESEKIHPPELAEVKFFTNEKRDQQVFM